MVRRCLIPIFLFFFSFLLVGSVSAATIISPLVEIEVEPGTTEAGVVKVYNETEDSLYLVSTVEDYQHEGQAVNLNADFLNWFDVQEKSIILLPKQVFIIPFTVSVPENAVPGGYYAVIYWQTAAEPGAESGQLNISGKVGTLVFVKVKGEIKEDIELSNFDLQPAGRYQFSLPVGFSLDLENVGNIHLRPEVKIEITDWFGQKQHLDLNEQDSLIFPGKAKHFASVWGAGHSSGNLIFDGWNNFKEELGYLTFGRLKAKLLVSYGEENKEMTEEFDFWFFPKHLLIGLCLIIALAILFLIINRRMKKIKKSTGKFKDGQSK